MKANVEAKFVALADPTRRHIFERLARRPSAVVDLARLMPVSRPAVSQHLKALKLAGLVRVEARGARHLYFVDLNGLEAMRQYLDGFWTRSLAAFKAEAEKKGTKT